jgi:hypothetical protein
MSDEALRAAAGYDGKRFRAARKDPDRWQRQAASRGWAGWSLGCGVTAAGALASLAPNRAVWLGPTGGAFHTAWVM